MSSRPSPEGLPPRDERSYGPYSQEEIRSLFTASQIFKTLVKVELEVEDLEKSRESDDSRIRQAVRQLDESRFSLAILEGAVARHGERLRKLDNIVFAVKIIGGAIAAILVPFITYLYRHTTVTFHP
jgi:hypothetical protein